MKIKTLPLFLLATTAAGAVLSAYLFQENRSLQTALEKASRAVGPSNEPQEIRIVEPSVAAATPPQEASEVAEPVSRRPPPDRFERFRQMREDPNFQRAMLERSKSSIERNYAGLFRALDLDEEGVEILKTLLAERSMMERQAAFQRRADLDDPEALLKAELSLEKNLAQIDRSLAEVLGEEKYATYDYYRDTLPQRQSVDELARRLSYSGTPLTEERAEVLVGVMAEAENSHNYTMDLARLSRGERSLVTEIDVALYLDEKERLNQMILSEAAEVLEQDQLEALAEQQMREVEQIERRASFGMGFRGGFGGPPGG
jgi:DNA repair exonuclease SbcCD ATPase subunit